MNFFITVFVLLLATVFVVSGDSDKDKIFRDKMLDYTKELMLGRYEVLGVRVWELHQMTTTELIEFAIRMVEDHIKNIRKLGLKEEEIPEIEEKARKRLADLKDRLQDELSISAKTPEI